MAKRLFDSLDIPVFNRIERIEVLVHDIDKVNFSKQNLVKLTELKTISVRKKRKEPLDESIADLVEQKIPACRIELVEQSANEINIQLNQPSLFSCKCE